MTSLASLKQSGWTAQSFIESEDGSSTTVTMERPPSEFSLCNQIARTAAYSLTAPVLGVATVTFSTLSLPCQVCWKCENECPNPCYDAAKCLCCAIAVAAIARDNGTRINRGEYVPYNQTFFAHQERIERDDYGCEGKKSPMELIEWCLGLNEGWYNYLDPAETCKTTCFSTRKVTVADGDATLQELQPMLGLKDSDSG